MEAMHADTSRVGASFLSKRSADNPRELLVKLFEDNPAASKDDLFKLFTDAIEDDPGYLRAVKWYFFVNMYEYATRPERPSGGPRSAAKREATQQVTQAIIQQIVVLDLTMPNGKPMKECSGAEMLRFGARYQKIGERVGKTKNVGEVLSEDQVKAILK